MRWSWLCVRCIVPPPQSKETVVSSSFFSLDEDVEEDPPSRVLMPDEIEYVRKGVYEKIKTKFAFTMARRFVKNLIDEKKLIIKEIKGIENFNSLKSGAVRLTPAETGPLFFRFNIPSGEAKRASGSLTVRIAPER